MSSNQDDALHVLISFYQRPPQGADFVFPEVPHLTGEDYWKLPISGTAIAYADSALAEQGVHLFSKTVGGFMELTGLKEWEINPCFGPEARRTGFDIASRLTMFVRERYRGREPGDADATLRDRFVQDQRFPISDAEDKQPFLERPRP